MQIATCSYAATMTSGRNRPRTSLEERAYGSQHRARRKQLLAALAEIGAAPCPRCGQAMTPEMELHLDHSNPAAKQYGQPGDVLTHAKCNTAAGGRLSQAIRAATTTPTPRSLFAPPIPRTEAEIEADMIRLAPHHDGCRCRQRAQSRCW